MNEENEKSKKNKKSQQEKYALDIEKKFGSYEAFIEKLKKGEIDYHVSSNFFLGYRGIVLSEKDMTQTQKLNYAKIVKDILGEKSDKVDLYTYIDVQGIEEAFKSLSPARVKILKLRYGLEDGKSHFLGEIAERFNVSHQAIQAKVRRSLSKLREQGLIDLILVSETRVEDNYKEIRQEMQPFEIIKEYITNPDGTPKNKDEIEDIELSKLGIAKNTFVVEGEPKKTIFELISTYNDLEILKKLPIQKLNLCNRLHNALKRANVNTVNTLIQYTEEDIGKVKDIGAKFVEEIKERLRELGLYLKNEEDKIKEDNQVQDIQKLIEYCQSSLEEYYQEIKNVEEKIRRYEKAKTNYLEKEDIFDPEGTVLGVPINISSDHEQDTAEVSYNSNEQKSEIIENIKAHQKELEDLKEQLLKLKKNKNQLTDTEQSL